MDSSPKIYATEMPRGSEKVYNSHKEAFWGELGGSPSRSKNSLGKQGKDTGFEVL